VKKPPKEVKIGERIKEIFDKSDLSVLQFAELLHCDRTNAYNIFRRKKIDLRLLVEISKVLNHDFVEEVCRKHGITQDTPPTVFLTLEIIGMDDKMLNKLLRTVREITKDKMPSAIK